MSDGGIPGTDTSFTTQQALQKSMPMQRRKATEAEINQTAQEFEGMFLSQMLSCMWAGVETDGMFGGGSAEETYRGMMINEYGSNISKAGGLGIADAVRTELLRMQEAA